MENQNPLLNHSVYLRKADSDDALAMERKYRDSASFHSPWVTPPDDIPDYIKKNENLILVIDAQAEDIAGFFNLSGIIRGRLQQAFLGYAAFSPFEKTGAMAAGLLLLLEYAFHDLELHRIEANIQPENERSKYFIEKAGFIQEGFSMNYLFLDGEWRDHERWAITREIWELFRN